jgi:hypothetical protein
VTVVPELDPAACAEGGVASQDGTVSLVISPI